MHEQGAGGGLGIGATGTHGDQAFFGLHHVAIAGDDQGSVLVGDRQHGFQAAQGAVGAPVLGQLDGGPDQVALVLLELRLEALEEGKGVGGTAGETGQHLAPVQPPDFLGVAFHDGIAQGNLAVAADHDLAVAAYRNDGGQGNLSALLGAVSPGYAEIWGWPRRPSSAAARDCSDQ